MLPVAAGASVDAGGALDAYARARLADLDGAAALAIASYQEALDQAPDELAIARRAYFQAVSRGDMALALQSAAVLDRNGVLPRDASLLRLIDSMGRKDWPAASRLADRIAAEENFAFLVPILRGWIAVGQGQPPAGPSFGTVAEGGGRFGMLTERYADEHVALHALAKGDRPAAIAAIRRDIAALKADGAGARLTFAAQLAAHGSKAEALALLPADQARFARARTDIEHGRGLGRLGQPLTPRQAVARLLLRLSVDVASEDGGGRLAIRLVRLALFADPASAEGHIVAARMLTLGGYAADGAAEARQVAANGWYGALAQAELVDALAAGGEDEQAIRLARLLADAPGAEAERFVRLGQLLSHADDYAGAATAFRRAQVRFAPDAVPWALLLLEGAALERGARWDEARGVLERAAALAPNEAVILNYLGYAQVERRQNVPAALALLEKASALKPKDPAISDSLGWAKFIAGDVAEAVPVLERAAAGAPADVTINEHLGDALWAAGRRFEARYAWKAASAVAEGDAAARLEAKAREGMKPAYAAR